MEIFLNILYAVLALGIMGAVFAAILGYASKIFYVKQDERLPLILDALPGANCGGCGYPGCSNFAQSVIEGKSQPNGCPVGGEASATKIAEIMGVTSNSAEKKVAFVYCSGGVNAKKSFNYAGITDCNAVLKVLSGDLACSYGCLGYGTCVKACPFDAIEIIDNKAVVDKEKCTACSKCIAACPKDIIGLIPDKQKVKIPCMSKDKGITSKNNCEISCIGCKICQKECPFDAIEVTDNLAKIDYDKCKNCGKCIQVCPRKLITKEDKPVISFKKISSGEDEGQEELEESDMGKKLQGRYRGVKRRKKAKNILICAILLIVGIGVAVFSKTQGFDFGINMFKTQEKPNLDADAPNVDIDIQKPQTNTNEENIVKVNPVKYATYLDMSRIADDAYINYLVSLYNENKTTAIVIPIKNDDGSVNYISDLSYESLKNVKTDLTNIIAKLKGVQLIAEISAYADDNFTKLTKDAALKTKSGGVFKSNSGKQYIDPYSDAGQKYLLDIVMELKLLGFDSVLFKDFRFPIDGAVNTIKYNDSLASRRQILINRLREFNELEVNVYLNVSENALVSGTKTYEDPSLLNSVVNTIFIDVSNDKSKSNFDKLNITNKGIISTSGAYFNSEYPFIVK